MAVRTRRTSRKWLGIGIFIALVIVSGFALNASGDLQNPFSMFMQASGGEMGERPDMGEMPEGERPEMGEMPEGGGEGGGVTQSASLSDLQWDQIGGVLYNLWVMAAASAVIMLVAPVVGMAVKPLRRNRTRNRKQKLAVQADMGSA